MLNQRVKSVKLDNRSGQCDCRYVLVLVGIAQHNCHEQKWAKRQLKLALSNLINLTKTGVSNLHLASWEC